MDVDNIYSCPSQINKSVPPASQSLKSRHDYVKACPYISVGTSVVILSQGWMNILLIDMQPCFTCSVFYSLRSIHAKQSGADALSIQILNTVLL